MANVNKKVTGNDNKLRENDFSVLVIQDIMKERREKRKNESDRQGEKKENEMK